MLIHDTVQLRTNIAESCFTQITLEVKSNVAALIGGEMGFEVSEVVDQLTNHVNSHFISTATPSAKIS